MICLEALIEFPMTYEISRLIFFPPKVDINESIKALYVSMDESKKITPMLRVKREFFRKSVF